MEHNDSDDERWASMIEHRLLLALGVLTAHPRVDARIAQNSLLAERRERMQ